MNAQDGETDDRRLIEDYLPIETISAEASREKSVRKGHISTLHLWWARKPLVACRAAVYGALVPADRWVKDVALRNPPADPEKAERFENGAKRGLNRRAAAEFVTRLCKYPGDPKTIAQAQQHILEAHAERLTRETGKPVTVEDIEAGRAPRPKVLDMFAGGGAIRRRIAELFQRTGLTVPDEPIINDSKSSFWTLLYGLDNYGKLFTPRQMLCLLTFAAAVREAQQQMAALGHHPDRAKAVVTYMGLMVSTLSDWNCSLTNWINTGEKIGHAFARQALPMVWDSAELAPFGDASGNVTDRLANTCAAIGFFTQIAAPAAVARGSATALPWPDASFDAVVTDPPYYDNVSYANLADFFYVWLKRTIGHLYPEHFATALTPKKSEVIAAFYRHGDNKAAARAAYEDMMAKSLAEAH